MAVLDTFVTILVASFIVMVWVAIGVMAQELIKNYKRGG